jgi:hypothetical protein
MLLQYTPGFGLRLGGPILPVVPVICNHCANTILVNAVIAGLVKGDDAIETPPEGGNDGS